MHLKNHGHTLVCTLYTHLNVGGVGGVEASLGERFRDIAEEHIYCAYGHFSRAFDVQNSPKVAHRLAGVIL